MEPGGRLYEITASVLRTILDLTTRPRVNYRTGKCRFWNTELPQRIEEKRQKDAEQSKPPQPEPYDASPLPAQPKDPAPPPPPPWIEREPIFSLPTAMPDDPMLRPGEYPDEPNPGEEPSAEPSDKRGPHEGTATAAEETAAASSSAVVSLIIIIGILFLLVNVCAFGGIYYQRDKLRVRERLFNNRFRCDGANTSHTFDEDDDDDDDHPQHRGGRGGDVYMKTGDTVDVHKFNKSQAYDSVAVASVKPEAIGGKRLGKWAEISRQRSSSTLTMDPHTRVKEWINTEIIQRYSPRILRRQRREEKKRQLVCAEDPLTAMTAAEKAPAAAAVVADAKATEKQRNKVMIDVDDSSLARLMFRDSRSKFSRSTMTLAPLYLKPVPRYSKVITSVKMSDGSD